MAITLKRTNYILAGSVAIPFLATLAFTFYANGEKIESFWVGVGGALLLLFSWYQLFRIRKKRQAELFWVGTIESGASKIPESFIAYVLPLLFAGARPDNVALILFCTGLYLFLLVVGNTVYPSVVFPLLGYRLYKVTTVKGISCLLLTKKRAADIAQTKICVVEIDDCCFMEVDECRCMH